MLLPGYVLAQVGSPGSGPPVTVPETRKFHLSGYEEATIAEALAQLGLTRDPAPEGKIVEAVDTVRLEVIEERDPAPRILNAFHVVTRPYVVLRELLLAQGDVYRQTLADESQRNLAAIPQFSLVLVIAARGSTPDRVRLVVITKDVWSLRLNWDIALSTGGLEGLSINPTETNLLGTQQSAGLLLKIVPLSYSFGAQYVVPRLMGTHAVAAVDGGLIFNRTTGAREGSFGDAQLTYPLWSSLTEWSWGARISWLKEVTRLYTQGHLAAFALDPKTSCATSPTFCVPWAYLTDFAEGAVFVTRSYGWAVKHDVSLGFDARKAHYALPDLSAYDPATVSAFAATRVPVTDDRVGPYAQYRTYSTNFLRVLDVETLALQEDYRLGPQAYVRVYPVFRALGSSRTFIGTLAGASETVALGDGLARVSVDSTTEVETDTGKVSDGSFQTGLRVVSPRLLLGRLVLDGVLLDRYADYLNTLSYLGGESRLRGYPSQYFVGPNMLAVNVEYRSRPWQLLRSVQLGGVVFFDMGDAFEQWQDLHLWESVGVGARILFPQLDRVVFRVDLGFPLARPLPPGISPASFFVTFGQAFPP